MRKLLMAGICATMAVAYGRVEAQSEPKVYTPRFDRIEVRASQEAPAVDVWVDQNVFTYDDYIRPYFRADPGAYVTIVRVTTDGELKVLYPRRPGQQTRYREGALAHDRLPWFTEPAYQVRESSGTGFIFAIASYDRFDYKYYTWGSEWSGSRLASSGRGADPFNVVRRFIDQTLSDRSDHSVDYTTYDVNSVSRRSRYATRFSSFGYDDYYMMCLDAFRTSYLNYCRSYYGSGFAPFVVTTRPNTPGTPAPGNGMRPPEGPRVGDPMVPDAPQEAPTPAEGRLPHVDIAETAAMARRERMLRDARPRVEMKTEPGQPNREPRVYTQDRDPAPARRSAPQVEQPRMEQPRMEQPRMEQPRMEQPRMEQPRSAPVAAPPAPRVEVRAQPQHQAPSEPAKTQKDN